MEGYAKLASLMGGYPEVAILRRFGALNIQNLLYLQAELIHLETELRESSHANQHSGDVHRVTMSKDWFMLAHYHEGNERQWAVALRIREKLKEYGDALLLQKQLCGLETPNAKDLDFLQNWMKRPSMGCVYLLGQDSETWEKPDVEDLVALRPRQADGLFSSWVTDSVVHIYHRILGRHFRKPGCAEYSDNTVYYSQEGILRVASLVTMCVSSLLPIAAISALYSVRSMVIRLAMVAVFTVIFTLCLGILTKARSVDIFTATTAFAAVQAVFISANGTAGQ
ncbi:hypothetical protein MMC30_003893 [Trapelia coarctata]|nr:hypothetical protein [Trapelia coarctata]